MTNIIKYSYQELYFDLKTIIIQIEDSKYAPTLIMGISRGGLIPAVILSHYFNVPLYPYHISLRDNKRIAPLNIDLVKNQHLLVVDNICDTGETFDIIYEKIESLTKSHKFLTLHYKATNTNFEPDFFCNVIDLKKWVEYPWENWKKND